MTTLHLTLIKLSYFCSNNEQRNATCEWILNALKKHGSNKNQEVYCLGGLDIEAQHTCPGRLGALYNTKAHPIAILFQRSPGSFLALFRNVQHIFFCASKEIFILLKHVLHKITKEYKLKSHHSEISKIFLLYAFMYIHTSIYIHIYTLIIVPVMCISKKSQKLIFFLVFEIGI